MMGKTQKFSKGHPLGFVPDYRHGVETVGESKGFESPACVEPKRKCISLNTEEGGEVSGFNVPKEVFLLPRMSASDKKQLETRLREELTRVRDLQNRLFSGGAAVSMNGGTALAPRGAVDAKIKDGKLKQSNSVQSGRGVPPSVVTPTISSTNYTGSLTKCGNLLKVLMTHAYSTPFLVPVDAVALNIPDYFEIIKNPMDLGTIQKKLKASLYLTPWEFAADVRLTFSNATNYNPVNNDVHVMAKALSKIFESRWRSIEKNLPRPDEKPSTREPSKKDAIKKGNIEKEDPFGKKPSKKGAHNTDIFEKEDDVGMPILQPKKRKVSPLVQDAPVAPEVHNSQVVEDAPVAPEVHNSQVVEDGPVAPEVYSSQVVEDASVVPEVHNAQVAEDAPVAQAATEIMTDEEKKKLSNRMESYEGLPNHIIEFIRRYASNDNGADEEVLMIDMNTTSAGALFELQQLLDDYDRVRQSENPTEEESYAVELQRESRFIDASVHDGEGNELFEEDVDIGGNDPPLLTYPPEVFESEIADRSSKHSSTSSSSTSDSASSSDSDSNSSSESDLNVKVPPPNSSAKENALSVVRLDQESDSLSTLNLPEQSTDHVPISADDDGENASDKHVSPGKQYRAALLRSRFADTILKAREKTLDQVAKKDPEKVRREREELERLQREERARLQAEAKAAEEARKRAEAALAAVAAAEAKRQRELEREAARKALQQMEKTVEINEGSLFFKDLEMLGTVTGEHLPSSVGETSPSHTPEALGFQLGCNPLEQLGLYMKNDDEEDEESESADEPTIDVEEGEID